MKHYGMAQWVDFARGLTAGGDAAAMRDHVAACGDCREIAEFSSNLQSVCRRIKPFEVPEPVILKARAVFPLQFANEAKSPLRIAVELIFDSFLVPAPAGLRASWQVGWQGLYRAGDCSLDLRIEPELRSSRAAVIGQISNHVLPETRMADIPVCLKSGRLVVAETRSNQFGEFQMEYEQQKSLQLVVYLDGGAKCIQVPVKQFAAEKPAGVERLNLGNGSGRKRAAAVKHSVKQ